MTLRDFQQTLTEKVRHAGTDASAQFLLEFKSGEEHWLVNLADAGEVLPVPALAEVPLTKPWFRGIANIRGTLYSVTDLAAFHGLDPTPIKTQTRLLLAGTRSGNHLGSNMALLISGTQGLKALAAFELVEPPVRVVDPNSPSGGPSQSWGGPAIDLSIPAPAGSAPAQPWRGEHYRDSEGRIWTHLLLPVLLGASEFLDIAA